MTARRSSTRQPARGARGGATSTRRGPPGFVYFVLGLVGFVLVASAVVWRRSAGIGRARELAALDARRVQLEAERAALQGRIRQASGRAQIGQVAQERLGLHVPADTQVVTLTRPPSRGGAGAAPAEARPRAPETGAPPDGAPGGGDTRAPESGTA